MHLNTGLQKLQETEEKVKEMQGSLAEKKIELETKEKQANEKLQLMITEQNFAE